MSRTILIYDSDCGFCRWCLGKVLAWDRDRAIRPVALGTDEADGLLGDMPADRQRSSWHLVDDAGGIHSAGAGFPPLLRLLPAGGAPAGPAAERPRATHSGDRVGSREPSPWGEGLPPRAQGPAGTPN